MPLTKRDKHGDEPPSKRQNVDSSIDAHLDVDVTPDRTTIKHYLEVNVKPVFLPTIDTLLEKNDRNTMPFPPLILDGASGVGKTQQAFALLKTGEHKLVYLNLAHASGQENSQPIYTEMQRSFGIQKLLAKIDDAITEVQDWGKTNNIHDPLSINSFLDYVEPGEKFTTLVRSFLLVLLKYNETKKSIEKVYKKKYNPDWKSVKEKLKENVLFVDEALPRQSAAKPGINDSTTEAKDSTTGAKDSTTGAKDSKTEAANKPSPKDRLKFLRNLGRALRMRVVLAGTAATAANMWTRPADDHSGSRHDKKSYTWAVVEFLYPLIPTKSDTTESDTNMNRRPLHHRPLVHHWLKTKEEGKNKFDSIIDEIPNKKTFTEEAKFIWLSGACLSSKGNTVSPFHLKPSALVQNHFFEPSLATYSKNKTTELIYTGKGLEKIQRKIVPRRLEIIKFYNGRLSWTLREISTTDLKELSAAVSFDYFFVEYALTNCVQVCLATEPLLAFCLSTLHNMERKTFEEAIRDALPAETTIQRNKGALDGELHEQIIFAALQLSSNGYKETRTVEEFVMELHRYLRTESDDLNNYRRLADALKRKGINVKPINEPKLECTLLTEQDQELFSTKRMPWLVPACSEDSLRDKIREFGQEYFNDFGMDDVAGLVPGDVNARMDAKAVGWKTSKSIWEFEFRARAYNYTVNNAMKDLKDKMERNEACHGMLIAIRNTRNSHYGHCTVEVNKKKYLRVVVLIGKADG